MYGLENNPIVIRIFSGNIVKRFGVLKENGRMQGQGAVGSTDFVRLIAMSAMGGVLAEVGRLSPYGLIRKRPRVGRKVLIHR